MRLVMLASFLACVGVAVGGAAVTCDRSDHLAYAGTLVPPIAVPVSLADGAWTLRVERESDGKDTYEPLSDGDFRPVPDGESYTVLIRGNGYLVEITSNSGGPPMRGIRDAEESARFELDNRMTGASLTITWSASGPEGELIVYGSGLPIVGAKRGPLERLR